MYIGNVMLLILNLPLVPMWVQVLRVPYKILFPLIVLFCMIGAYSLNNSIFDVYVMLGFGFLGYLFRKFGYESAPLVLAFVLGPIFEMSLRQSLLLSRGSFSIFFSRPISAVALLIAALIVATSLIPHFKRAKKEDGI
jgi:putative tricarboxylic transport membrane protein